MGTDISPPKSSMLTDDEIYLRVFRDRDLDSFMAAIAESHETVGKWLPWCHKGYTAREALNWFRHTQDCEKQGYAFEYGIFSAKTRQLIGGAGISDINTEFGFGAIGYWVRQSSQGRGVASRAVKLLSIIGLRELGLHRLEIIALVDNAASRRVAEKVGARFEGIARNRLILGGVARDAALYSLIPDDLNKYAV